MTPPPRFPSKNYSYSYLAGPVETREELDESLAEGNCRLALQLYFYKIHNLFLERDQIYLPGGYKTLGEFVYKEEPILFEKLEEGDIVYAQNLRGKDGAVLDRSPERYQNKDEWLYHLHSAIYVGRADGEEYIWHATSIEGGTAVWPRRKFEYYYKPISIKRVL